MALTDFDSLKEAVQKYCARSDSAFSNRFENFLLFAEDRMYQGAGDSEADPLFSKPLRSKTMEATATVEMTAGTGTLPSDVLGTRTVWPSGQRSGLEYLTPERFSVGNTNLSGSFPMYYTVVGSTISVTPSFTGNLIVNYWQRFAAINTNNKTGSLLSAHPTLYFSAVMFEAMTWLQEVDAALGHLARYRSQVAAANNAAKDYRFGAQGRRIRPRAHIS